jgi:Caspase domain
MARRAALFGCNYAGTKSALHGCINDVRAVHEMLVYAYQFDPQVGAPSEACCMRMRMQTVVATLSAVRGSTPSSHMCVCALQNITVMTDDRQPLPTGANMKVSDRPCDACCCV